MQHRNVGICAFLPANENSSEAIHPTMSAFDDPAPSFEAGGLFDRLGFLATTTNVSGEVELSGEVTDLAVIISLVQTESLRRATRRDGTLNRDALERGSRHLEVHAVGAVDDEAERDSARVRQYAAFRSSLGTIRWIGTGFFPLRAAPYSSRRPSTASSNPPRRIHRRLRALFSTPSRRLLPPSIRENVGAPTSLSRCPWRSKRSTGNRYGARTGWRSSHHDLERVDYGNRGDVAISAQESAVQAAATRRREFAIHRRARQVPWKISSQISIFMERRFLRPASIKCEMDMHGIHGPTSLLG